MRKLVLTNYQCPGDILMLTAAVRDLHQTYPGQYLTKVRTSCDALWKHSPYLSEFADDDPDAETIACDYPLIHQSNQLPYHFIHGFRHFLNDKLDINIKPSAFKGDIHLSDQEKSWISQVEEITGRLELPMWIVVSGGKRDYTAKWYDPDRLQLVVDHFQGRIQFVQCGEGRGSHCHPALSGVIDLVGKTDLRQMVRLMYHADGVICPVTMFMHLAAAVETKSGAPINRPCVVLAGGREPVHWEAYPHHTYLHTASCLPCCDNGGCWRSRVVALGDGCEQDSSLCELPVQLSSGEWLPKCLDMLSEIDIIRAVERCLGYGIARSALLARHAESVLT